MKEKPIIFSTPMVKAILEGRKTQTRRVVKPQPEFAQIYRYKGKALYEGENRTWCWKNHVSPDTWHEIDWLLQFAPYQPGDILWVRETVWQRLYPYPESEEAFYWGSDFKYVATDEKPDTGLWVKRPAIHMPRKAARIFLLVKSVRVERVQDITDKDARAEGVIGIPRSRELYQTDDYIYMFKHLWDSINAKREYSWNVNPWVWVIEFERMEGLK